MQNNNIRNRIVAGTTPTIKRSFVGGGGDPSTNMDASRIILRDVMNYTYVVSSDHQLFYKNSDTFKKINECKLQIKDVLEFSEDKSYCSVTACGTKNCKTCN